MEIDKIALLLSYYNLETAPIYTDRKELEYELSEVEIPDFLKNQTSVKYGVFCKASIHKVYYAQILMVYLDFPCLLLHYKKHNTIKYYVSPMNVDLISYDKIMSKSYHFDKPKLKMKESDLKIAIIRAKTCIEDLQVEKHRIEDNKRKSDIYILNFKKSLGKDVSIEYRHETKTFVTNKIFEFCFDLQKDGTLKESVKFIGDIEYAKEISKAIIVE